jgi:hypothetical protein
VDLRFLHGEERSVRAVLPLLRRAESRSGRKAACRALLHELRRETGAGRFVLHELRRKAELTGPQLLTNPDLFYKMRMPDRTVRK